MQGAECVRTACGSSLGGPPSSTAVTVSYLQTSGQPSQYHLYEGKGLEGTGASSHACMAQQWAQPALPLP